MAPYGILVGREATSSFPFFAKCYFFLDVERTSADIIEKSFMGPGILLKIMFLDVCCVLHAGNCREICYAIFKSSVVLTAEFIIQMPEMLPHFENAAQVSMNTPRQTNGHGWSETNFVGATCDSSAFLALRNP